MDALYPPTHVRSAPVRTLVALIIGCIVVAAAAAASIYALVQAFVPRSERSLLASSTSIAPSPIRVSTGLGLGLGLGLGGGDINCSVTYTMTQPCEGDCWSAYAFYEGTVSVPPAGNGAPCPPLAISISCAGEMPCLCKGADLPITAANSVTTCNDCTYLQPNEVCYLRCADPGSVMMGTPEITCANGTWAFAGLMPTCSPVVAQCPAVMNVASPAGCGAAANNGIVVQPGGTCVGATNGDTCTISCLAGYAIAPGGAATASCADGTWSAPLVCAPQEGCVGWGGDDTCAGACAPKASSNFGQFSGALLRRH